MAEVTAPPAKRPRPDCSAATAAAAATSSLSPLAPALLSSASRAEARHSYRTALPYEHALLTPLCEPSHMDRIKDEITRNLRATFKETDLFKLYQTIDLANLSPTGVCVMSRRQKLTGRQGPADTQRPLTPATSFSADEKPAVRELCAKMPALLALRDALYAPTFRAYIQELTGCPTLTERVDMAASVYTQGCHLLCHDDVIGTRAVSFIVYLTDAEWSGADGGALQLYPLQEGEQPLEAAAAAPEQPPPSQQGVPAAHPTTDVLPLFNSMAVFAVRPGRSYHSVQEVYTERTPRLSIQGWYHAATPPAGAEQASLSQLKSSGSSLGGGGGAYEPLVEEAQGGAGVTGGASQATGAEEEELEEQELRRWKLGALSKRARADGVGAAAIEEALDADDPKAELIALLLAPPRGAASPKQPMPATGGGLSAAAAAAASAAEDEPPVWAAEWALSDADRRLLSGWVQPAYLRPAAIAAVRAQLGSEGSVQLQQFLCPAVAQPLAAAAAASDAREFGAAAQRAGAPSYGAGLGGGWNVVGPAHMQRYLQCVSSPPWLCLPRPPAPPGHAPSRFSRACSTARRSSRCTHARTHAYVCDARATGRRWQPAPAPKGGAAAAVGCCVSCPAGRALGAVAGELFRSAAWGRLLAQLSGVRPTGVSTAVRRFRPGLDYTVAHHGLLEPESRLDATLCFVGDGSGGGDGGGNGGEEAAAAAAEAWEGGGAGAYECYMAAEEEELVAAETYGGEEDEGNQLLSVTPASNTLNLVMRDEGTMRFIKCDPPPAPLPLLHTSPLDPPRPPVSLCYLVRSNSTADLQPAGCPHLDGLVSLVSLP
jgi:Rps23 Pro-64 3,4-dihydroxylase Tpa1-like proline 4-hydroxylase